MATITAASAVSRKTATIDQLKAAIANRQPITELKAVVTHPNAHLDEIFALWLIMNTPEGKKMFAGITTFAFNTQKELKVFSGKEGFYQALKSGYLLIGTCDGPFDEHGDLKNQKSCSDLIVKHLGLLLTTSGRIIYTPFLNFVNYEDRHGLLRASNDITAKFASILRPAMLADSVKDGWKLVNLGLKDGNQHLLEIFGQIQNQIETQKLFVKARKEFEENTNKQVIDIPGLKKKGSNRMPCILVVKSDNTEMASAAKNVFSQRQDKELKALLIRNSKGQFYLTPMNGASMEEVSKIIRMKLALKRKAKNSNFNMPHRHDLANAGTLRDLRDIYYHKDADSIMNGSFTQTDIAGIIGNNNGFTKEELVACIVEGLNPQFHHPLRLSCRNNICVVKQGGTCPLYDYNFEICHDVRMKMVTSKTALKVAVKNK